MGGSGYNVLWRGKIGGREIEISVGAYDYRIAVDRGENEEKYYFATLEHGLEQVIKHIVRKNMRERGKYKTLSELIQAVREEYKRIREEIEEAIYGREGQKL